MSSEICSTEFEVDGVKWAEQWLIHDGVPVIGHAHPLEMIEITIENSNAAGAAELTPTKWPSKSRISRAERKRLARRR